MQYIDEKFKDAKPEDTVKKIKGILDKLGIEVYEEWHDSGLENCYSLSVLAKGGTPSTNGKGVTKELARASAYAEFIERLQGGLLFYKYQSIIRNSEMNLHASAPDCKYMTVEELEENGDWMDQIIDTYKYPRLTRKTIAQKCKMFACADDGKILTLPFYSLFEKKYVYLPIAFVDQIYATNGCCAGNTREEGWVHALSEILERHANVSIFTSGKSAPKFSPDVIDKYPIVSNIIRQVRESGDFDIDIFDYSLGSGFPVVSTRIINKKTHSYMVKVAADPIFEIALQRNLTELFQGRNIKNFTPGHSSAILNKVTDYPLLNNIYNQLEAGNGLYTADFFADEITCQTDAQSFADNSNKNNRELLDYALSIFKKQNKQIYVRNFSYLGFPSYRFVIPGFSEALALKLIETVPEYSIGDMTCKFHRNPISASNPDLKWLLVHSDMVKPTLSKYNNFGYLSGVPIVGKINLFLIHVTRAYASYRLKAYDNAINYLNKAIHVCDEPETEDYFSCINKYLELKKSGIDEEKIKVIICKFFIKSTADKLFSNLENGKTPYDEFLLNCDFENCDSCKYKSHCCYENSKRLYQTAAKGYSTFVNGQDESEFLLD
ncbi:MAG: YcaO-like family protein [Clostridia bacterium]|nr:YcaO-like family protein [Clostridia bacterium]